MKNWRIIATAAFTVAAAIVGGFGVYNLEQLGDFRKDGISTATKAEISRHVLKSEVIVGALLSSASIERNTQEILHWYFNDPMLETMYLNFINHRPVDTPFPLFIRDDKRNGGISSLLNNEFGCIPFNETLGYRYIPAAGEKIKVVCVATIPPQGGGLKGILLVYLKRPPTEDEKDRIRIAMFGIANMADNDF
jgi:hypothetical protein